MLNYKQNISLSKYIFPTFDKNIDLLPTGPMPPNPVELLASEKNKIPAKAFKANLFPKVLNAYRKRPIFRIKYVRLFSINNYPYLSIIVF